MFYIMLLLRMEALDDQEMWFHGCTELEIPKKEILVL
jgi:hypothetical protein